MKKRLSSKSLFILFSLMIAAGNAAAAEFTVTIKNLTHGIYFTPFLITAHDSDTHLFRLGQDAGAEVSAMAEGGDISGLSDLAGGADEDTVENPAGGLLGPGEIIHDIPFNTNQTGNTYLSLTAMMLPTNDGFVGLDSLHLPTAPGRYTFFLNGYDAGTEANDEIINGGGAPGTPGIPAAPGGDGGIHGTGVTVFETNTTVHIHRGTLGDTDLSGGKSDLDSTVHRWQNPVGEIIIDISE